MSGGIIEDRMEFPAEHLRNVYGQFDEHIKKLERSLNVTLVARDGTLRIVGPESNVRCARGCLEQLLELSRRGMKLRGRM